MKKIQRVLKSFENKARQGYDQWLLWPVSPISRTFMDLHPPIRHQDHQGPYEEGVLKISQELSSNEAKTKETCADNACCRTRVSACSNAISSHWWALTLKF